MRNTNLKKAMAPLPLLAVLILVAPAIPAAAFAPRNDEPASNSVIEPSRIAPNKEVADPVVPTRAQSLPRFVPVWPEASPSAQPARQLLPAPEQQFALVEPKVTPSDAQFPTEPLAIQPEEEPSPKAFPYSAPFNPDSAPNAKIERNPLPDRPEADPSRAPRAFEVEY